MRSPEGFILSWIKYIAQIFSFLIFSYILSTHLFRYIKPTEEYIDQNVFNIDYLRFILFLGFVLGFTGWAIAILEKKIKAVSPFSKNRKETFFYLLIGFFFAVFYNGLFAFANILQYPIFVFLVVLFYFFIPQLVVFYTSFRIEDFKMLMDDTFAFRKKIIEAGIEVSDNLNRKSMQVGEKIIHVGDQFNQKSMQVGGQIIGLGKDLNKKSIEFGKEIIHRGKNYFFLILVILFSLSITAFALLFVSGIIKDYIKGETYKQRQNRKKFFISRVIPQAALHAQRVKIEGYNFGWKSDTDGRYRLLTTDGPVKLIEEWTDERLEFTVPIDLAPGKKKLWIEKPPDDPHNLSVMKSNEIVFEVYSRFVLYPELDDSKFERLAKKIKKTLFFTFPSLNHIIVTSYE